MTFLSNIFNSRSIDQFCNREVPRVKVL